MSDALATSPELLTEDRASAWHWIWRAPVGFLCYLFAVVLVRGSFFGFFGTLMFVGWCQRWVRRRVIGNWWRAGGLGSTALASLSSEQDPRTWPNWVLPENRRELWGSSRGLSKRLFYTLFHSLWLNLRAGLQMFLNTAVLLLPTGLMWSFGWFNGWDNSFNKGYEQFAVGQSLWWTGTLLFVLAMFHVPLAQAHQAVTGRWSAIYEFRAIRILARQQQRTRVYLALAYTVGTFPITGLISLPAFLPQMTAGLNLETNLQYLQFFNFYLLGVSALAVPIFFLLRVLTARIYARAVELAIARGEIEPGQLGDDTYALATRLLALPERSDERRSLLVRGVVHSWRSFAGMSTRFLALLLWITLAFQVVFFAFFNYHGVRGHMLQPMIHAPYMDFVPEHLKDE